MEGGHVGIGCRTMRDERELSIEPFRFSPVAKRLVSVRRRIRPKPQAALVGANPWSAASHFVGDELTLEPRPMGGERDERKIRPEDRRARSLERYRASDILV